MCGASEKAKKNRRFTASSGSIVVIFGASTRLAANRTGAVY